MESRLFKQFDTWDVLHAQAHDEPATKSARNAVLKTMQALLSNRTYVTNVVNELVAAVGERTGRERT